MKDATPFDWHQWQAESYPLAEVGRVVEDFGTLGKKIVDISIIGAAHNLSEWNLMMTARAICVEAGVSYEEFDSGRYPHIDKVEVPCEAVICEPLVITFEDGGTFELQAMPHGMVKMSVGQIPGGMKDGANHTNIEANILFSRLLGAAIISAGTNLFHKGSQRGSSDHKTIYDHHTVEFRMTGDHGLSLLHRQGGWYTVSMTDQYYHTYDSNPTATLPYGEMKKALIPVRQIEIVEGHDSSSYFWIKPIRAAQPGEKARRGIVNFFNEQISIEEGDIYDYLSVFLCKYFDEAVSAPFRDEWCEEGFQWWLEHNVYTYATVKKMLADIRQVSRLLQENCDDPALDEVKSRFREGDLSGEGINAIVDFYDRFCRRMEAMMAAAPEYKLISFMGP